MATVPAVTRPQGVRLLPDSACPQCGSMDGEVVLRLPAVPIVVNTAWTSEASARTAARLPIDLASCSTCQLLYNASFDDDKISYTETYGNALHYSDGFRRFSEEIAAKLSRRYALKDKLCIEIGCGDGYFLDLLCRVADCKGIGIDPSSTTENRQDSLSPKVSILSEYFEGQMCVREASLVTCRQVLEHFQTPLPFLKKLRAAMDSNKQGVVFFEVPNAEFMVERNRFWDVIYEHCLYLSPYALRSLFVKAGFTPITTETTFGDQYVSLEARANGRVPAQESMEEPGPETWRTKVERFSISYQATIRRWREFLDGCRAEKKRVVVWGAGAKTIMFLNLLRCDVETLPYVIDISPAKQGNYISGTGQQIVAPEILEHYQPDFVLLMNDNYRNEVTQTVSKFPGTKLVSV